MLPSTYVLCSLFRPLSNNFAAFFLACHIPTPRYFSDSCCEELLFCPYVSGVDREAFELDTTRVTVRQRAWMHIGRL